jgi:cysteine dioxygenase
LEKVKHQQSNNNKSDESITSLTQLVEALKSAPVEQYISISNKLDLSQDDVLSYASWSDESYTRNCLELNDKFELILLCWEPGQITPIHDHGGEECWVYFVNSQFQEIIYEKEGDNLTKSSKAIVTHGDISYMSDFMGVHSLQNIGKNRGFSLHLYAKPITSCNVFNDDLDQFELVEMNYDTQIELTN